MPMPGPQKPARGSSLIEVMIALAVLAVGLLAMWHLHMVGLSSTGAGRRHTVATGVARELASGLERLAFNDPRLADTVTGQTLPAGAAFGNVVQGDGSILAGARPWDDAAAVPGVRRIAELPGQGDATTRYDRRWTVWGYVSPRAPAGTAPGVKIIAVSVTWRDPPFARPREVVLYTQVTNPAALATGLGATP
jgi:prepilin-type N-terminal cleavage/methylation domain-containing protein